MNPTNPSIPPLAEGFYARPRLSELLQQAIQYSVSTVVAGAGFGKTQTVASFAHATQHENRTVWLSIRKGDNSPHKFWHNFIQALQTAFPELDVLPSPAHEITQPEEMLEETLRFIQTFASKEKLVFIIDNFERLTNDKLRELIYKLVDAFESHNACWIIISQIKCNIAFAGLESKTGLFEITQNQLEFTREEVENYYRRNGVFASVELIDLVMNETEGWPLLVRVTLQMLVNVGSNYTINLMRDRFYDVFESRYYLGYSEEIRMLLVQLSLLNSFTMEILQKLVKDQALLCQLNDVINEHAFIRYNHLAKSYRMHNAYRMFLQNHKFHMPEEQIKYIYDTAGEVFLESGQPLEAMQCYHKNRNHGKLLQILNSTTLCQLDQEDCNKVEALLVSFPADYVSEHPDIELLQTYADFYNLRIAKAEQRLQRLLERFADATDDLGRAVAGEAYLLLASISILQQTDGFVEQYKKAAAIFPAGGYMREDIEFLFILNYNFYLQYYEEGEIERLRKCVKEIMPCLEQFQRGAGKMLSLYVAMRAAYYTFDLVEAEKLALQYIIEAREESLMHAVLHGHWQMVQIALLRGNLALMEKHKKLISEYTDYNIDENYFCIRDHAEAIVRMTLNCPDSVPAWMLTSKNSKRTRLPIYLDEEHILAAYHLSGQQKYSELLHYLDVYETQQSVGAAWPNLLRAKILRAVAYMRLDNDAQALQELWSAYQITYKNNIVTPFIGSGNDMRALIKLAQSSNAHDYNQIWLQTIHQKASTYAKRRSALGRQYCGKLTKTKTESYEVLTKNELAVLKALSQGMTREEISSIMHVSNNTVKTIIKQIYIKLDAVNNANAVRIAFELGLLD